MGPDPVNENREGGEGRKVCVNIGKGGSEPLEKSVMVSIILPFLLVFIFGILYKSFSGTISKAELRVFFCKTLFYNFLLLSMYGFFICSHLTRLK